MSIARPAHLPVRLGFLLLSLAVAVSAAADNGDPSSRPSPLPPPYTPDIGRRVGTASADGLEYLVTVAPQVPNVGELMRVGLIVHDAAQKRDFQGEVKVSLEDGSAREIASGIALTEDGEASFLAVLPASGRYKFRFAFSPDIPAWAPERPRPGPSQPPLAVGSEGKGKVWCEFDAGRGGDSLPLPLLVGGAVLLAVAAAFFLRKRRE